MCPPAETLLKKVDCEFITDCRVPPLGLSDGAAANEVNDTFITTFFYHEKTKPHKNHQTGDQIRERVLTDQLHPHRVSCRRVYQPLCGRDCPGQGRGIFHRRELWRRNC